MEDSSSSTATAEAPPTFTIESWKAEIESAKKFMKKFHTNGKKINKRYLDEEQSNNTEDERSGRKFNLFWANIAILKSALYGNIPMPVVERKFQDANDDVARVAAEIMRRLLITTDCVNAFGHAVEDRLIPGMGQTWFRYDAEVVEQEIQPGVPAQIIKDEEVDTDYVYWQDFFYSPARVWGEVTWVARRVYMTRQKVADRFPSDYKDMPFSIPKDGAVFESGRGTTSGNPGSAHMERAEIFEIWCKLSKKVYWVALGMDHLLDEQPDPLKLPDFWPCPRPLMSTTTTTKLIARADYTMVQDQYTQLDEINVRLGYLIQACKVVGVYDKTADGVQRMFNQATENQLIPVDNWAMFAEKGGIKGQVDWLPIEAVAAVIGQLREERVGIVQQIYELTGLSDIMRGVTNARETFGAQKLKAQYSSSRLQLYQGQVAEFVEDGLQIKALIISKHWQPETILRKSNIMNTPDAQYAQQAIMLIKNSYQLMFSIRISNTQMSIPDYNAEKQSRMEYVQAMGQFIAQATPAMEKLPESAPFLLRILQWAGASFHTTGGVETLFDNFIKQAEGMLQKKLTSPPPPPPPLPLAKTKEAEANAAKRQAEAAKTQKETAVVVPLAIADMAKAVKSPSQ